MFKTRSLLQDRKILIDVSAKQIDSKKKKKTFGKQIQNKIQKKIDIFQL